MKKAGCGECRVSFFYACSSPGRGSLVEGEGSGRVLSLDIKLGVILGDSDSPDSVGEKGSVDCRLPANWESNPSGTLIRIVRIEVVEHAQNPAMPH